MVMSKDFSGKGFAKTDDAVRLSDLARKSLPEAVEDEYGVLACIFNSPHPQETFLKIAGILQPEHMLTPDLRKIWGRMMEMHSNRLPIDFKVFTNYLQDWCNIEAAVIKHVLDKVYESAHEYENAAHYAERIVRKYESRELVIGLTQSTNIALDPGVAPEDALTIAERGLRSLREKFSGKKTKRGGSVGSIARGMVERIRAIARGEAKSTAVRTGSWYDFDQACGGMVPGEVIVIGAPPGGGKSTTAFALAHELAKNDIFTLCITLEMGEEQCVSKLLSPILKQPSGSFTRDPSFSEEQADELEAAVEKHLAHLPLAVKQPSQITIEGVERLIAEQESEFREIYGEEFTGFRVIVFDYLQYLGEFVAPEQKASVISSATVRLGNFCKTTGATLIAFAQLNSEIVKSGKLPENVYCFADCNAISKHADQIIIMHSDGYANRKDMHNYRVMKYVWLKNREGGTASVEMGIDWTLGWIYPLADFSNYSYKNDPASQARKIEPVKPKPEEWKNLAEYAEDDTAILPEQPLLAPDHPDFALATPKGTDIAVQEVEPITIDILPLPLAEAVQEPAEALQEELSAISLQPSAEDSSNAGESERSEQEPAIAELEVAIAAEGSVEIKGRVFESNEECELNCSDKFYRVKVVGWEIIALNDMGLLVEFLESKKDHFPQFSGKEYIFKIGDQRLVEPSNVRKLT